MPGFSSVTGLDAIVYADNVSFDGTERGGSVGTDGQLLIGSTATPHIKVGTLTQPAAGMTITGGSGSITFALADDLAAVEALATTGIASRTAANTWALSSVTEHSVLVGGASETVTSITPGTTGELLIGATGGDPAFGSTAYNDFSFSNVTSPATPRTLAIVNTQVDAASTADLRLSIPPLGGDSMVSFEVQGTLFYSMGVDNSDSDTLKITNSSAPSAGDALLAITQAGVITLHNDLDVTEGGTGVSTFTSHGILLGNGTGDLQVTAEPSNGQLLIGNTGNNPSLATLTEGAGITVTNAAGSITIAASGGGLAYSEITDATQAMAIDTCYTANRGGGVTFTLPATAAAGSVIEVVGKAGLWSIAQNAGQTVYIAGGNTTAGVGGSLTATNAGDCVCLRCITADTDFRVQSMIGNLAVV